jgi:small neutral amino acid transporter SnatA (MarC family)
MVAVRAVHVAMVVVVMIVVMVVAAIGTVHMGLLGHRGDSAVSRLAGIISPIARKERAAARFFAGLP